jgi:hypothetical protein
MKYSAELATLGLLSAAGKVTRLLLCEEKVSATQAVRLVKISAAIGSRRIEKSVGFRGGMPVGSGGKCHRPVTRTGLLAGPLFGKGVALSTYKYMTEPASSAGRSGEWR